MEKEKPMKKIKLYSMMLLTSLSLTACQGAGESRSVSYDSVYMETENIMDAGMIMESGMGESRNSYSSNEEKNVSSKGTEDEHIPVGNSERKLIKNVSMDMETTKFNETIQIINKAVTSLGGYVESSGVSGRSILVDSERYANIRVRIPQEKLDEFLENTGEIGNITYKNESIQDVSLQYADTEDHIKTLETEQKRLLTLLEQADSIETIIAVEERLSNVRYELESYRTQIKLYDNKITYSTVQINLNEVKIYSSQNEDGMITRISKGIKENSLFVVRTLENLIVLLVSSIPMILVLTAGFWIGFQIIKRLWKKKKQIKEED